jgi:succinate dehydrogenase / fumarate reductase cytochrome b subunit
MKNTLIQKYLMALTGLFLCLFLVIHLAGNLPLLLPPAQAQEQFNRYADFLSRLYLIKAIAWLLYISLLLHIIYAVIITIQNRRANSKIKYAYDRRRQVSSWASRHMGWLGTVILLFLVIHLQNFWYASQFGSLPEDELGKKNLYAVVVTVFQQSWYVGLYLLGFAALGFHLWHGFIVPFAR